YISDQYFSLISANNQDQPSLVINRSNSKIYLGLTCPPNNFDKTIFGFLGLFGIIRLIRSDYLILIKSSREYSVHPITLESNQSLLENSDERYLLSILKYHLDQSLGKIFQSYNQHSHSIDSLRCNHQPSSNTSSSHQIRNQPTWDPTTRLQAQCLRKSDDLAHLPLRKRADDHFFYNKFLQSSLINLAQEPGCKAVNRFILPVIYGFLEFKLTLINGKKFNFGLISRRSRYRAGTRYFSRGINLDGNISNFNKTEMIFYTNLNSNNNSLNHNQHQQHLPTSLTMANKLIMASFVQTHGSVPIFWTEINNLRYKPDLKIMEVPQTQESMKAHFNQQVKIYGDQYLVNLVNSSGFEKPVKDYYEQGVRELGNPRIHYVYFDFHHECREEDLISNQGYFFQEGDSNIFMKQVSVVRSNCMDWRSGILFENKSLDSHHEFMYLFRNLWADKADAVSKAYSGTGALKTDFTRFGIRSKQGALNDLLNSCMWYVKNKFLDGPRQDSYDLVTGSWNPKGNWDGDGRNEHEKRSLEGDKKQRFEGDRPKGRAKRVFDRDEFQMRLLRNNLIHQIVLFAFVIYLFVFILSTFSQRQLMKVWIGSLAVLLVLSVYMLVHSREFINLPKLNTREVIIKYNGPGYQSSKNGTGLRGHQSYTSLTSTNKRSGGGDEDFLNSFTSR
ncbi:SacI homology domain-domain-containing protein, partial [Phakopsora pachyrhizi]